MLCLMLLPLFGVSTQSRDLYAQSHRVVSAGSFTPLWSHEPVPSYTSHPKKQPAPYRLAEPTQPEPLQPTLALPEGSPDLLQLYRQRTPLSRLLGKPIRTVRAPAKRWQPSAVAVPYPTLGHSAKPGENSLSASVVPVTPAITTATALQSTQSLAAQQPEQDPIRHILQEQQTTALTQQQPESKSHQQPTTVAAKPMPQESLKRTALSSLTAGLPDPIEPIEPSALERKSTNETVNLFHLLFKTISSLLLYLSFFLVFYWLFRHYRPSLHLFNRDEEESDPPPIPLNKKQSSGWIQQDMDRRWRSYIDEECTLRRRQSDSMERPQQPEEPLAAVHEPPQVERPERAPAPEQPSIAMEQTAAADQESWEPFQLHKTELPHTQICFSWSPTTAQHLDWKLDKQFTCNAAQEPVAPITATPVVELEAAIDVTAEPVEESNLTATCLHNIQWSRNPHYLSRPQLGWELEQALIPQDMSGRKAVALTGMAGCGKSQLVLDFIHNFGPRHDLVWWIDGRTMLSMKQSILQLCESLQMPAPTTGKQCRTTLISWMEQHENWLLIFDGVDDPMNLRSFINHGRRGKIIITSRVTDWEGLATPLEVPPFTPLFAEQFLIHHSGENDEESAARIAQQMGYLPLALEQVVDYLQRTHISLREYLSLYLLHGFALLEKGHPRLDSYTQRLSSTWDPSLKQLELHHPTARKLLDLFALLPEAKIPREALARHHRASLPTTIKTGLKDDFILLESLEALARLSLIKLDERNLILHPMLRCSLQHAMPTSRKKRYLQAVREIIWSEESTGYGIGNSDILPFKSLRDL
uniref:NACHT domain-containing protein n=1 Tax=Magnetococcus massalia (strain MO-1) TaxID=451514 RepID=A0A1S7LHN8_MAGMO|nr:Protein of unknown function [Candidatus Magnetococcus massalia]